MIFGHFSPPPRSVIWDSGLPRCKGLSVLCCAERVNTKPPEKEALTNPMGTPDQTYRAHEARAARVGLRRPPGGGVRGASTRKPTGCRTSLWPSLPAALHALLTNPMWLLTSLGYSAYTFVIGALAFWGPTLVTQVSLRCVHASGACKHTSGHRLHSEPMQFQYPQVRS